MPDASIDETTLEGSSTLPRKWPGVQTLLLHLYPHERIQCERRREKRFPFPYLMELTPVDEDGCQRIGENFTVVGKHISEHGLGFFSQQPIPYRHVIAMISNQEDLIFHMLVDLLWCRFSRQGWYENGGRMLGEVGDFDGLDDDELYSE